MNDEIKEYLSKIGRIGGSLSRRTITPEQQAAMQAGRGITKRNCDHCGKEFIAQNSCLVLGKSRCCSASCQYAHRIKSMAERFERYVIRTEGCWNWTGSQDKHGYGILHDGKRLDKAPRISWRIHNGPIPPGMYVCHHCDNPNCINPNHLFLGTQKDNMQDAKLKGRLNVKLPSEKREEIQNRKRNEHITQQQLATDYGVCRTTIKTVLKESTMSSTSK